MIDGSYVCRFYHYLLIYFRQICEILTSCAPSAVLIPNKDESYK